MRVLVLGASGIIGQTMRCCVPDGIDPLWYRQTADLVTSGWDLSKSGAGKELVQALHSSGGLDAVVNLAGVSDVDAVEQAWLEECEEAAKHYRMNVLVPRDLAEICGSLEIDLGIRYVHVSSQAVFDGKRAPLHSYFPASPTCAVNEYGSQKIRAEAIVRSVNPETVIVRPSLVLGVRPMPHCGRKNPIEGMLDGTQPRQVADRWFSPLFARDAAQGIWDAVCAAPGETRHLGIPRPWSRYEIAGEVERLTEHRFTAVRHDSFEGLAPRPRDTTYGEGSYFARLVDAGVAECLRDTTELYRRAREIAVFLGIREEQAVDILECGFGPTHNAVTNDFNEADAGHNEESLLDWYRETSSYIWELSAYHMDPKYDYPGLCRAIGERLKEGGVTGPVLCLGDGIGDLTMSLDEHEIGAWYHDLRGSRTAGFAKFRYWNQTGHILPVLLTDGWAPEIGIGAPGEPWSAVVALDFLEHVPNVEAWVKAVWESLSPGGIFVAQNAFAMASGEGGEMPMHLALNDRYEQDWDPTLARIGFRQLGPQWYQKPC